MKTTPFLALGGRILSVAPPLFNPSGAPTLKSNYLAMEKGNAIMKTILKSALALAVGCIFVATTASAAVVVVDAFNDAPTPNPVAATGSNLGALATPLIDNTATLTSGPFDRRNVASAYTQFSFGGSPNAATFTASYGVAGGVVTFDADKTAVTTGATVVGQTFETNWFNADASLEDLSAYNSIEIDVTAAGLTAAPGVGGLEFYALFLDDSRNNYARWDMSPTATGTISLVFSSPTATVGTVDWTKVSKLQMNMGLNNIPTNSGHSWDYSMDEVRLIPIPEPGSVALLGIGGLAMLMRRRLRRAKG